LKFLFGYGYIGKTFKAHNSLYSSNIIKVISSRRMRLVGHIACMKT
jgi:hypothetical protein